MVIVYSPLMHKQIIEKLEASEEPSFTYKKKEGIELFFETDMREEEQAAKIAKKIIKEQVSDVIMFKVRTEEYLS